MKTYTPQEMRTAVFIAVVLTVVGMLALLDPACQPRTDNPRAGPLHSIAPRGLNAK